MNYFAATQQTSRAKLPAFFRRFKKNEVCAITEQIKIFNSLPKKIVEIKADAATLFNSPSLLFFPCSVSSQQKVFWKVGVSKFFVEILEKH